MIEAILKFIFRVFVRLLIETIILGTAHKIGLFLLKWLTWSSLSKKELEEKYKNSLKPVSLGSLVMGLTVMYFFANANPLIVLGIFLALIFLQKYLGSDMD